MKNSQLFSSRSEHWCTPSDLVVSIKSLDLIGLDPCSNSSSVVNAKKAFSPPQYDGLMESWQGEGLVYCNPPYGRSIVNWLNKIEQESFLGAEIIALLPARTDTQWFHEYVLSADTLFFVQGRLKFIDGLTGKAGNPATFPSVIAYWGPRPLGFVEAMESSFYEGWFTIP